MSRKDDYTDVLLEDINSKFDTVVELVGTLKDTMATKQDVSQINEDIDDLKSDIKVVKAAVTDSSKQIRGLEHRLAVS